MTRIDAERGGGEVEEQQDGGLSAQLAEARRALYRPDADDATRARYEALRRRSSGTIDGASPSPRAEAVGGRTGEPREWTKGAVALALVLLVCACGTALLVAQAPPRHPDLASGLRLSAALDQERSALPAAWRKGRIAASSDALDGATALHAHGQALLVVRCPAADRSFQAVTRAWVAFGACGRLAFLALADGAQVTVTTRGVLPFSAALLVRDSEE